MNGERLFPRREALRILAVSGVSLGLGGGLVRDLIRRGRLTHVRRTEAHMGTLVTLACVHPEAERARGAVAAAFAGITRLERVLSRHDPAAQVARLNREGVLAEPDPALREVLVAARRFSEMSDGAFDVTIAPLVDLFAGRYRATGGLPSAAEIEEARERVDYRALSVAATEVRLRRPRMAISLDGIAKGYVVDRTVAGLMSEGFSDVLVEAGGDIGSAGTGPDGSGWRVAIEVPSRTTKSGTTTRPSHLAPSGTETHLRGEALASSGDAQRSFTEDRSVHHIMDPRTGRSPLDLRAVSVRAGSAMEADALSTAVMVLGGLDGLALLNRSPGVEGRVIHKDDRSRHSAGWESGPYPAHP